MHRSLYTSLLSWFAVYLAFRTGKATADGAKSSRDLLRQMAVRLCWLAAAVSVFLAGPSAPSLYGQQWIAGYFSAGNTVQTITEIPWDKYTHIIHFAASTPGDGTVVRYYLRESEIAEFQAHARPQGQKVLVAIKDYDSDFTAFPRSASPDTLDQFVQNIVNFVVANGYDGVDLDWEKNVNVSQYISLLTKLRDHPAMQGKVITMAATWVDSQVASVAAGSQSVLDQINVMCYDFDWDGPVSWYVGALRNDNFDRPTCDWAIAQFTSQGVSRSKIGVGIPFYGRRWRGVIQALQPAQWTYNWFSYRNLVADPTRWQPQYRCYDYVYRANYLSIDSPTLKEFDSYTGVEFVHDAVAWQKSQGFGGFMTFTLEYEYLREELNYDARYPLSTALYNAALASPPPVPSTLTATAGNGEVRLAWSGSPEATRYLIKRRTSDCGPSRIIEVPTTSYTDTDVTNGITFYYIVTAVNAEGESGDSNQASATPTAPLAAVPSAPSGITAKSGPGKRQIKLTWNASTGAASYSVKRSTTSGGSYATITTGVTSTNYTNTGLTSGTVYYYVVSAVSSAGESMNSLEASAVAK